MSLPTIDGQLIFALRATSTSHYWAWHRLERFILHFLSFQIMLYLHTSTFRNSKCSSALQVRWLPVMYMFHVLHLFIYLHTCRINDLYLNSWINRIPENKFCFQQNTTCEGEERQSETTRRIYDKNMSPNLVSESSLRFICCKVSCFSIEQI